MKLLCMSDIHCEFERFDPEMMPEADVVIIAGDLTNFGNWRQHEYDKAKVWLNQLSENYQSVVWISGNHDNGISSNFTHTCCCIESHRWTLSNGMSIRGVSETSLFGPNCFNWNMTSSKGQQEETWSFPYVDIVVSHGPPFGICDNGLGSPYARAYIDKHHPKLFICGHIHEGAGEYQHYNTRVINVARRWVEVEI